MTRITGAIGDLGQDLIVSYGYSIPLLFSPLFEKRGSQEFYSRSELYPMLKLFSAFTCKSP